jgi:hypothetical protein
MKYKPMNLSEEDIKRLADSVTDEEIKAMFDMFMEDYHHYQYEWLILRNYSLKDILTHIDDEYVTKNINNWISENIDLTDIEFEFDKFLDQHIANVDLIKNFKTATIKAEDLNIYKGLILYNYSLEQLFEALDDEYILEKFQTWEDEIGFNGEIYVCRDEFYSQERYMD